MRKSENILQALAALEGNLDAELQRLALLRSQGKLPLPGGIKRGHGYGDTATIRFKIDTFRAHVMDFTESQCWNWTGRTFTFGYGVVQIKFFKIPAHRFSFAIFNQRQPCDFVCHHCDNPFCVNPNHLFEGTHTDNMRDCSAKGRQKEQRGERSTSHKLKDAEVRFIRSSPLSYRDLSDLFGVSRTAIYCVKRGRTWTHLLP